VVDPALLFNAGVDAEIRPQPTTEERQALLAALGTHADDPPPVYASAWRSGSLEPADDYDATARPRSRRGATRA
jgi:hypothetical protein